MYKKIIIYGGVGAGKTSFAKKLSDATNLPLFSIDDIVYDESQMKKVSEKIKERKLKEISKKQKWVVEGTHMGDWTLPILKKARLIILLDYKKKILITRIIKRYNSGRTLKNPHGKIKSLLYLLYWALRYNPDAYRTRKNLVTTNGGKFIEISNDAEAKTFLKEIKKY